MSDTKKDPAAARFHRTIKAAALAAAMLASAAASAQTAGTWFAKVGYNEIMPQVSSGDMSASSLPGTKADVGNAGAPIVTGGYMFTDHWSTELYLGTPYKHDVSGAGAIQGSGKLGTVEFLPPTLFGQYRFLEAKSAFRPYVGLGLTYVHPQKETGSGALTAITNPGGPPTTFSVSNEVTFTPQIGVTYSFNEHWFADFEVSKTFLKNTVKFSSGQTLDIRTDPVGVALSIGYRF